MNSNSDIQSELQKYIIAVLKSSAMGLAKQVKDLVVKVDPYTTIKQILAKLKKQLNISANDSVFLYAYGSILNSEDTVGNVYDRFKDKIGNGKLELRYSEMSAFGVLIKQQYVNEY